MARGAAAATHFSGAQHAADAASIEAFVASAHSGERFTYCSAPQLIRGEGSARAAALADAGLVTTHQQRREGGGWNFLIIRTGKALPAPTAPRAPSLNDADLKILAAFRRAVNLFAPCPSDAELARLAGLDTRDQAKWSVRKLVKAGLVATEQVTEDGVTSRIVRIGGKMSLPPPRMLAAMKALKASTEGCD